MTPRQMWAACRRTTTTAPALPVRPVVPVIPLPSPARPRLAGRLLVPVPVARRAERRVARARARLLSAERRWQTAAAARTAAARGGVR